MLTTCRLLVKLKNDRQLKKLLHLWSNFWAGWQVPPHGRGFVMVRLDLRSSLVHYTCLRLGGAANIAAVSVVQFVIRKDLASPLSFSSGLSSFCFSRPICTTEYPLQPCSGKSPLQIRFERIWQVRFGGFPKIVKGLWRRPMPRVVEAS